jgi:hypothetical protein
MSRDPLDTNLSAMIDQAQSIAVQLRVVQAPIRATSSPSSNKKVLVKPKIDDTAVPRRG